MSIMALPQQGNSELFIAYPQLCTFSSRLFCNASLGLSGSGDTAHCGMASRGAQLGSSAALHADTRYPQPTRGSGTTMHKRKSQHCLHLYDARASLGPRVLAPGYLVTIYEQLH